MLGINIFLHPNNGEMNLAKKYIDAFENAQEIMIVNAYLTSWDSDLRLNSCCNHFRMIIGKDFGITRKAACLAVMRWLPPNLKANFLVADEISGFHPKAVFWKDLSGNAFAIIGSSNLTTAAFSTNFEANIACEISLEEYLRAKKWVENISDSSVPVSDDWLDRYVEAVRPETPQGSKKRKGSMDGSVLSLTLPNPRGMKRQLKLRRKQILQYGDNSSGLMRLFRQCAGGKVSPDEFYARLPEHWGGDAGGRLQGKGWERLGQGSDFRSLCESFVRIVDAEDSERDDVVIREIDRLAQDKVSTRSAFLTEMLCLKFPALYPVVNKPVKAYLADIKFRAAKGATEGARYLDLARKLRVSLKSNPDYLAKNLAELDTAIWLEYHK